MSNLGMLEQRSKSSSRHLVVAILIEPRFLYFHGLQAQSLSSFVLFLHEGCMYCLLTFFFSDLEDMSVYVGDLKQVNHTCLSRECALSIVLYAHAPLYNPPIATG